MTRQLPSLLGLVLLASCVFDTAGYSPDDTPAPDTGSPDHPRAPDRRVDHAAVLDRTRPDTRAPDTRAPDHRAPDTRAPDSRRPDTLAPDTRPPVDLPQPDSPPLCSSYCGGCCQGGPAGYCQLGDVNTVCGSSGATCEDCTATGKVCLSRTCTSCSASSQCPSDKVCLSGSCVPALPRTYRIEILSAKVTCSGIPSWDSPGLPDLMVAVYLGNTTQLQTSTANNTCSKSWGNAWADISLSSTDLLTFTVADVDVVSPLFVEEIGSLDMYADQLLPQLRSGKSEQLTQLIGWSSSYVESLVVSFTPLP